MNWIDQLIELHINDIPITDYGYWILPDGDVLVVPYQGHHEVARKYLEEHPDLVDRGKFYEYDDMYAAGCIRVIADPKDDHLSSMFSKDVSKLALNTLRNLIRGTHHSVFYIDQLLGPGVSGVSRESALSYINKVLATARNPETARSERL